MAGFTVKPTVLKEKSEDFVTYSNDMKSIGERIDSVKARVQSSSTLMTSVISSMTELSKETESRSKGLNILGNSLVSCAVLYLLKESEIAKFDCSQYEEGENKATDSTGNKLTGGKYEDEIGKRNRGKELYKDKEVSKGGKKVDEKEYKHAEKKATIIEASNTGEVKRTYSEWGGATEDNNASWGVTVGEAKMDYSLSAGLYGYDRDGNLFFSPAVNAKVGASATVLEIEGKYQYGDENLGFNADGGVTVGKVSGEAEVNAALLDENGKFKPELNASASAEAIAAEAEGSFGIKVAGVDVKAKGSVNFGIGAHADVGFHDGVLKIDIGASVGVGASAGFEIDVGAFVSKAKSVWDSITGLF